MIIDCHAHLDVRSLEIEDMVKKMDEEGIGRVALMARVNDEVEPKKPQFLLMVQRNMMNSSLLRPVAAAVSLSFYDEKDTLRPVWRPFTKGSVGYVKTMKMDNESVAEAIEKKPDRFWGWIFLNPKDNPGVLDEMERWRGVRGMIGVKAHPYWHRYPLADLEGIARRAEEIALPLILHMGFGAQGDYRWLVESFPRLKIIYAHAGIPYFKALWPVVRGFPNAYMDLSSAHLSERFVRRAVAFAGPEKCLYGTDSPYGFLTSDGSYDYGRVKGWIDRLPVSERDRDLILGENFLNMINV